MSGSVLYDRDLLRLALELTGFPLLETPDASADVRAPLCGSTMVVQVALDADGRVRNVGIKANACAVGQAAAAIFAMRARGQSAAELGAVHQAVKEWLQGSGSQPDWPGIAQIAAVRDFPARHGAALLAFRGGAEAAVRAEGSKA